jgi:biopolymer transport protein ExbB/TolQ
MTADLSVYFKSLIAGALAALASTAVVFVVAIIALIIMSRRTEDGAS